MNLWSLETGSYTIVQSGLELTVAQIDLELTEQSSCLRLLSVNHSL